MVAAAAKAEIANDSARRHARMALSVPVSLTLSRAGATEFIPARALNVSEGGLSTALAGEIASFELVGLEFRLPDVGIPLKTKARVRHQSVLRCGLEFTGLSLQQRSMIRYWLQRCPEYSDFQSLHDSIPSAHREIKPHQPDTRSFRRLFSVLGIVVVVLSAALAGWYWQTQWLKIESGLPLSQADVAKPLEIPSTLVEKEAIHQVDPVYPESARASDLSGIVKLNVVIEKDGRVSSVTPLSGPGVFQPAAMDAVRWWRFKPHLVDGRPVRVQTSLAMEFRP
jgi:protein TonB